MIGTIKIQPLPARVRIPAGRLLISKVNPSWGVMQTGRHVDMPGVPAMPSRYARSALAAACLPSGGATSRPYDCVMYTGLLAQRPAAGHSLDDLDPVANTLGQVHPIFRSL